MKTSARITASKKKAKNSLSAYRKTFLVSTVGFIIIMIFLSLGERFSGYGYSERVSGEDGQIFPDGVLKTLKNSFDRREPLRLNSFDGSEREDLEKLEIRVGEPIEFYSPSFVYLEPSGLEGSNRWYSVREYLGWFSVLLICASCGTFGIIICYWNPRSK
jgi:hypothetical protein